MKKHTNIGRFLTLFILLAVTLTACGGSKPAAPIGAPSVSDVTGLMAKAKQYYHDGVTQEKNISLLYSQYKQNVNEFRTGVTDLVTLNQQCFSNVASTESEIGKAVMGDQPKDGLINALATQSVSGEQATTACANANSNIADFIVGHRAAIKDSYNAMRDAAASYKAYTTDYPEIQWMNDLANTYGNPNDLYKFLSDNGIPGVTDWTWLPTENLLATSDKEDLCQYYISGSFKNSLRPSFKQKFTKHESSLDSLYSAEWNPALNQCTLYRVAALEYIQRDILSQGTRDVINTGVDDGAVPTVVRSK